jgi:hypothetical protein
MGIIDIMGFNIMDKPNPGNTMPRTKRIRPQLIGNGLKGKVSKKSAFVEDVDLLVTQYNDKAFLYNSGKVDIIKNGNIKTVKFKSKKDASVYLLRTGWNYV